MPTAKTFVLVAEVIAAMPSFSDSLRAQKASCASAFADRFAKESPRFKRGLFLKACGVE